MNKPTILRPALLWILWHHQGGSSDLGQAVRRYFGIGEHDHLSAEQIEMAKEFAARGSTPEPGQPAAGQLCEGLEPVDPALLQPFKDAMQNETIPAIFDAVRVRQKAAAEYGLPKAPSQPERGVHVSPEISDAARSVQDKKDLEELRPFYSREGVTALLKKYWPDMLGEAEPVARVGLAAHTLKWLSEEYFSSVPIGTLLYTRPAPRIAVPEGVSDRLIKLMVGKCTCLTKTPELKYHNEQCTYRLAAEIGNLLAAAPEQQGEMG